MAFTGGLTKKTNFSGNTQQPLQQSSFDRMVEVTGYDLATRRIYAKDEKREYEVYINNESFERGEKNAKEKNIDNSNFQGHIVDDRMQKQNPVGSKIVLMRSKIIKKDNGQGKSLTEAHWIGGVPNAEPDKAFQGIVSVSYNKKDDIKRINRAFVWDNKGIDIEDNEGIEKLKELIDAQNAENQRIIKGYKGEYRVTAPTIGVQFRALQKTDKTYTVDETPIYQAVDTSILFHWVAGPEDENGKVISAQSHTLTGDEMLQYAGMYAEHISTHPAFKDNLGQMKVEICPFKVYPASKNDPMMLTSTKYPQHEDKNPLYQLAHRRNFLDLDQADQIEGQNAAVNGIVLCGPDKFDKDKETNKAVDIPQYWVSKIHANNIRGHVHAFVRTSEGFKVEPHEKLQLLKPEMSDANKQGNRQPAQERVNHVAPKADVAPTVTPNVSSSTLQSEDPFGDDSAFGGDDPFDPSSAPPAAAEPVKATGIRFGAGLNKK